MPYLLLEDRRRLAKDPIPKKAGDINYLISVIYDYEFINLTKPKILVVGRGSSNNVNFPANRINDICCDYMKDYKDYQKINDCVGAITCATLEYCRRNPHKLQDKILFSIWETARDFVAAFYKIHAGKYEDSKIKANGDVYTCEKK